MKAGVGAQTNDTVIRDEDEGLPFPLCDLCGEIVTNMERVQTMGPKVTHEQCLGMAHDPQTGRMLCIVCRNPIAYGEISEATEARYRVHLKCRPIPSLKKFNAYSKSFLRRAGTTTYATLAEACAEYNAREGERRQPGVTYAGAEDKIHLTSIDPVQGEPAHETPAEGRISRAQSALNRALRLLKEDKGEDKANTRTLRYQVKAARERLREEKQKALRLKYPGIDWSKGKSLRGLK